MKTFYLLPLVFFAFLTCHAQKLPESPNKVNPAGQREGQWTIWYTKARKPTQNPGSVFYYRRISYRKDKPTGLVRDYYRSGKVRWEGTLLADRPKEIIDGKAVSYYENGNKEAERVYAAGKPVSEVTYTPDGEIEERVKWGNPDNDQLTDVALPGGFTLPFSEIKNALEGLPDSMKNHIDALPDSLYDSNMKEVLIEHTPDFLKEIGLELGDPATINSLQDQLPKMILEYFDPLEGVVAHPPDQLLTMKLYCNYLTSLVRTGKGGEAEELLMQVHQGQLNAIQEDSPFSATEYSRTIALNSMAYLSEYFNFFVLLRRQQNPAIVARMYDYQLATKALLFDANYRLRELVMNSQDTALKQDYQRWLDLKNEWASSYYNPAKPKSIYGITPEEQKKMLASKEEETDETKETKLTQILTLERQLYERSAAFATAVDREQPTWHDVQRQLKPAEAAIEMVRFRRHAKDWTDTVHYAALIVTPTTKLPQLVLLENGNDLEGRYARSYRKAIGPGQSARGVKPDRSNYILAAATDKLYQHYWGKIDAVLKKTGTKKIYFSPDGVYNSVNLNTLYNPVARKFVLDEYDVQLVTNTKDLITRKNSKTTIAHAALFGYPDYRQAADTGRQNAAAVPHLPADDVKKSVRNGKLERLQGTETEVNTIAGLLAQHKVKVNKRLEGRATEAAIKQLDSPHILHIATHGFFDPGETGRKKATGMISLADLPLSPEDPLLRSGLFLAGAQQALDGNLAADAAEDGLLTAYEAMNLHLHKTDLVVLSACETGLGEIRNGEGVYGLQRAFQTAGARSVLMSLWKVDDAATQELMTEFYRQWLLSGNKRTALRSAQETIRARYPEPYYWGAFVLVGE